MSSELCTGCMVYVCCVGCSMVVRVSEMVVCRRGCLEQLASHHRYVSSATQYRLHNFLLAQSLCCSTLPMFCSTMIQLCQEIPMQAVLTTDGTTRWASCWS